MNQDQPEPKIPAKRLFLTGTAAGVIYGLTIRLLAGGRMAGFQVMSFGVICFMPFALGCVTTYYVEMRRAQRWWVWCLLPWLPLMGALVACMVMLLEGFICLVMFTPIAIVLSTVGGLAGGLAARLVRWRDARTVTVTCIALLPIRTAGLEQPVLHRHDARHVAN